MRSGVFVVALCCGCAHGGAGSSGASEPEPLGAEGEKENRAPSEGKGVLMYRDGYGGQDWLRLSEEGVLIARERSVQLSPEEVAQVWKAYRHLEDAPSGVCDTSGYHRSRVFPGAVQYNPNTDDPECVRYQQSIGVILELAGWRCGSKGCKASTP